LSKAPVEATVERKDGKKKKMEVLEGQMEIWWQPPWEDGKPPENGDGTIPSNGNGNGGQPWEGGLQVEGLNRDPACEELCKPMKKRKPDYSVLFTCPTPPVSVKQTKKKKK